MFFSGKAKVQHKMHSTGFHRPCHFEHWELRGSLIQWIALLVLVSGKPGELFLTQARWQDCLNHLKSQSPIKLRRKIPTGMRESAGERYKFNVQICKPRQIRPGAGLGMDHPTWSFHTAAQRFATMEGSRFDCTVSS